MSKTMQTLGHLLLNLSTIARQAFDKTQESSVSKTNTIRSDSDSSTRSSPWTLTICHPLITSHLKSSAKFTFQNQTILRSITLVKSLVRVAKHNKSWRKSRNAGFLWEEMGLRIDQRFTTRKSGMRSLCMYLSQLKQMKILRKVVLWSTQFCTKLMKPRNSKLWFSIIWHWGVFGVSLAASKVTNFKTVLKNCFQIVLLSCVASATVKAIPLLIALSNINVASSSSQVSKTTQQLLVWKALKTITKRSFIDLCKTKARGSRRGKGCACWHIKRHLQANLILLWALKMLSMKMDNN